MSRAKAAEAKLDTLTSVGKDVLRPYGLTPLSRKGGLRLIGSGVSAILETVHARTSEEEARYAALIDNRSNSTEDNTRWLDAVTASRRVNNYVKDFLSAYISWTREAEQDDEEETR